MIMDAFLAHISGLIKKIFRIKMGEPQITKEIFYTKDFFKDTLYIIGEYSYGYPKILHWGEDANLMIGKFCSIADNVTIFLGGNHRVDWVSTYPFNILNDEFPAAINITGHPSTKGNVIIGNDVWIGQGSTIMSGVKVGDGAVIGACSVVTKDVNPYEIVAGNPAKVVKKRFDDAIISQLIEIAWWNWPIAKINLEVGFLCNNDIENFINRNLINKIKLDDSKLI